MTSVDQIAGLIEMKVDFAGLIFYPPSPRYATEKVQRSSLMNLAGKTILTGVFVDEAADVIEKTIDEFGLAAVQLCGSESPEICRALRRKVGVIKVIHVGEDEPDRSVIQAYDGAVDYILLDTLSKGFGGSGKKFDWSKISTLRLNTPFFLSGGIGLKDAATIRKLNHPMLAGVDVNSRFETAPGVKDLMKIKRFITELRQE